MALNNDFKIKNGLTVNTTISAGGAIEGDSFCKHDGTSSQFLKADGSVDSTSYISGFNNGNDGVIIDASDKADVVIDLDSSVVRTSGNQNIGGTKSFSGTICANGGTTTVDALKLTSFNESSDAAPIQTFYRGTCSSADGDYLGQLKFRGQNSNGAEVNYAKITGKISDETNSTEDGLMEFAVQKAGTMTIVSRHTHDALKLINGTGLEVDGQILSGGTELHSLFGGGGGGSGTITEVGAGTGLTGGGTTGSVTLNLSAGDGVQATANCVSVDSTVVRTTGAQTIAGNKSFSNDVSVAGDLSVDGISYFTDTVTTESGLDVGYDATFAGTVTIDNALRANGGISVDTNCFVVDGTTGALSACSGFFRDDVTIAGDLSAAAATYTDCLVVGGSTLDGSSGSTLNGDLVVQNSSGQDYLKVSAGNVCFNTGGGVTQMGPSNLGARVNIQAISDAVPTLAIRGKSGSSDLVRVSSASCTNGDYFNINNDGKVGIGTDSPSELLEVSGNIKTTGDILSGGSGVNINTLFGAPALFNVLDDSSTGKLTTNSFADIDTIWDTPSVLDTSGYSWNSSTGALTVLKSGTLQITLKIVTWNNANNRHQLVIRINNNGTFVVGDSQYASRSNTQDEGGAYIPAFIMPVAANDVLTFQAKDVGVAATMGGSTQVGKMSYISAVLYPS